jgi:23S rRNA (guanosine2251-2'-O)-methyltransferase
VIAGISMFLSAMRQRQPNRSRARAEPGSGTFWLYGIHAARAALANPRRKILRARLVEPVWQQLKTQFPPEIPSQICQADQISQIVPPGAVHQGVALLCEPLPSVDLEEILATTPSESRRIAVLDQITDPHNEGAILRSAAAFGFAAVVVQTRHSPPETGVLAKAASGALDLVPRVSVVNIARALEEMGRAGVWRVALAADGAEDIRNALSGRDLAVVLGAEGSGLRRLVRERCDTSACIPVASAVGSLNVSNAAAIAFYEIARATA